MSGTIITTAYRPTALMLSVFKSSEYPKHLHLLDWNPPATHVICGNNRSLQFWTSKLSNESLMLGHVLRTVSVRDLNGLLSQPGNAKQHQTTMSFGKVLLHRGTLESFPQTSETVRAISRRFTVILDSMWFYPKHPKTKICWGWLCAIWSIGLEGFQEVSAW